MSCVHNYIVSGFCPQGELEQLQELMRTDIPLAKSPQSKDAAGGKAMEVDVLLLALNYIRPEEVARAMCLIKWEYPETVQLLACLHDEDKFTEIDWVELVESASSPSMGRS